MEETVTQPLKKGYKTIRIPMTESEYEQFPDNPGYARRYIDEIYGCHMECLQDRNQSRFFPALAWVQRMGCQNSTGFANETAYTGIVR